MFPESLVATVSGHPVRLTLAAEAGLGFRVEFYTSSQAKIYSLIISSTILRLFKMDKSDKRNWTITVGHLVTS